MGIAVLSVQRSLGESEAWLDANIERLSTKKTCMDKQVVQELK